MPKLIELKNISKYYQNKNGIAKGLENISLSFDQNEFVAITGMSGSGKSTLLNLLSVLDKQDSGSIFYNGDEIDNSSIKAMEDFRKENVSFIFQEYNLIQSMTVLDNVLIPLIFKKIPKKEAVNKAKELIEKVGLTPHIKHKVLQLSGGQQQRVVIARALAKDSKIIACDEPTGNLDKQSGAEIINLLNEIKKDKLILFVTHNVDEIKEFITREIVIGDGKLISDINLKENNIAEKSELSKENNQNEKQKNEKQNLIPLALKYFFSHKKKSFLMILTFLFFCFSILLSLLSYNTKLIEKPLSANYLADKKAFIIEKINKETFNENDITNINSLIKDKLIKLNYGFLYEKKFHIKYNSNNNLYEKNIVIIPQSRFENTEIKTSKGKMPNLNNSDEIAVIKPNITEKIKIGDVINFENNNFINTLSNENVPFVNEPKNLKVVGIVKEDKTSLKIQNADFAILVSDKFIEKYHSFLKFSYTAKNTFAPRNIFKLNLKYNYNILKPTLENPDNKENIKLDYNLFIDNKTFIINDNLEDNKILINFNLIDNKKFKDNFNLAIDKEITNFIIGKHSYTKEYPEFQIDYNNYQIEFEKDQNLFQIDKNKYKIIINSKTLTLLLNHIQEEKLFLFSNSNYNENDVLKIINTNLINNIKPYTITKSDAKIEFINLLDTPLYIVNIVKVISILILIFASVLIIGLIFNRIFDSKKSDYNIFRTLGANKKDINKFIFIENIAVANLTYLIFSIFVIISKILKYSLSFFDFFLNFKNIHFITLFFILNIIAILISLKYIERIYKKTVGKALSKGGSKK